jgi:hypothetical protein
MDNSLEKLTKKERRALKKAQKIEAAELRMNKERHKKSMTWVMIISVLILISVGLYFIVKSNQSKNEDNPIISRNGIHWHSELAIYVKGEKQSLPANIGIGAVHQPVHTHDDSDKGVVHLEFQGTVRERDATLGQFFKNWNKDMKSFGSNMRMTVNGKDSFDFENYIMQDEDKIELFYD